MTRPASLDTERQALALFERLLSYPGNARARDRLLSRAPTEVRARVNALEGNVTHAARALPTEFAAPAEDAPAVLPGTRIGAFRLTAPVGRGGMGEVWAAQRADGLFEQQVAIKLIQRRTSPRLLRAFEAERRILARLEHPNIARLIDGGVTEQDLPWLAMEFCDGRPIDEAAAGLPLPARVELFRKAAEAIRFAHSRMIAHADVKPSNVMVGADGQVKLLDFGIAALLEGEAAAEGTNAGALTRAFASPQRLAGAGPSVADDLFGLGRTLAAVLDGTSDRELAAIAAKASAPEEADRYGSADALLGDLDRWRAHRRITALPDTWRYRADKFIARNRRWVLGAGAALMLLGAVSAFATSSYFRAEVSRGEAAARSSEVRQLAHYLLYDLYDQLARQPGTAARRAQITQVAAGHLARLQADRTASPALRLDAARSYRRLAAIRGLPGISNVGQPEGALEALVRAEAILAPLVAERPREVAALTELGWVHADRWTLHADNVDSPTANRAARRWFDAALAIAPGNASARLGRLTTLKSEGYDLIWSADRPAEAVVRLRAALAELRATRWPTAYAAQVRALEINALNRLGDALYYAGDIPGSLAPYREADALIDAALAADGATPQRLILKGEAAFNISGSLGDSGHPAEALTVADAAVGPLEQLLRAGPDAAAEKRLLVLYGQQAALLGTLGRGRDALVPSGASVALREARLARSPGDPQRMRDLAIGLAPHATLLAQLGNAAEACAAATRAVGVWTQIRAQGRLGALDERKNMPQSETLQQESCGR
ncbi:MAG: hypothetical protein B7Z08_07535 [Sphingomonadales bacterium 32-68-7]|nr:MAG: hypothetical protein B7Z33_01630 [Sphingomonadales bacterium 12-68-11]OYX08823.1 MAG: hypothetical protein B7Z08_07535 [Sphingomonadales bacterium 32-68-7]